MYCLLVKTLKNDCLRSISSKVFNNCNEAYSEFRSVLKELDFRLADLETGEVQFTIQLDCCWNNRRYSVWGRRYSGADFEHDRPLFETDSVKELINWSNTPWEA